MTQWIVDELGADINMIDPRAGLTALHFAANDGKPQVVEMLLSFGANPKLVSRRSETKVVEPGQTALGLARLHKSIMHSQCAKLLSLAEASFGSTEGGAGGGTPSAAPSPSALAAATLITASFSAGAKTAPSTANIAFSFSAWVKEVASVNFSCKACNFGAASAATSATHNPRYLLTPLAQFARRS